METISGQFCPACKFKNELTVTTCVYCGASLENVRKGETTRRVEETKTLQAQTTGTLNEDLIPLKGIAIYTEDGMLVEIREEKEFFLGREAEDSEDVFVDLIPTGAFQKGVSRRHALVRQTKHGYELTDLSSTNGTYIDGARLVSNQPYPLPSASRVSLGRMHLLVLYTAKPTTKDKTRR
jgi:pSer/pThr/pTyr-binding forkhead associated (FHA) protein